LCRGDILRYSEQSAWVREHRRRSGLVGSEIPPGHRTGIDLTRGLGPRAFDKGEKAGGAALTQRLLPVLPLVFSCVHGSGVAKPVNSQGRNPPVKTEKDHVP